MQNLFSHLITLWDSYQDVLIALLKGFLILIFGLYLASFAKTRIKSILQHKDQMLAGFIAQIASISLLILTCITALGTLGIQTNSIVALLGTAGIAIALGLQNSLSNLASGVIIIVLRPFKAGDFIEFGSISGIVKSVSLFHTTLLLDNKTHAILPNETIAKGNIINHSNNHTKPIVWKISLQTSKNLQEIEDILQNALLSFESFTQTPLIKIVSIKNDSYIFNIVLSLKDRQSKEELFLTFIQQIRTHFSDFEASIRD